MGLLDFNFQDPKQAGLLALAQGLFAAGAPQSRRVGLGEALTSGLSNMANAQKQAQNDAMAMEMNRMQLDQSKDNILSKQKAAAFQAQIPQIINQFGNDYQGMIKAGVPHDLVKSIADAANYGRSKVARTLDVEGQDGSKITRQFDEYGNAVGGDINAYVAPVSTNLGDRVVFNKPLAGQTLPMGRSPDSVASQAVTMRGQDMTDARMRDSTEVARENKQFYEKQKQDEKAAAKELEVSGKIASFDTMLDSLDRLKKHKGLDRSVGIYSSVPTIPGSDSANFQAELETFQSQAFLPMVSQLKGMGALSDAEGKKLTAAVGALNPKMSAKSFRASLDRINNEMTAAKERVIKSTGQQINAPKASMRFNPATGKLERVE